MPASVLLALSRCLTHPRNIINLLISRSASQMSRVFRAPILLYSMPNHALSVRGEASLGFSSRSWNIAGRFFEITACFLLDRGFSR